MLENKELSANIVGLLVITTSSLVVAPSFRGNTLFPYAFSKIPHGRESHKSHIKLRNVRSSASIVKGKRKKYYCVLVV
jgi:hypothetical protein